MTAGREFAALLRWNAREWLRTRGLVLAVLAVLLAQAASAFMAGLAVTEVAEQHRVFYAGLVRPTLVLLLALTVVANAVRDLDERVLETQLARPLGRGTWYLAKLAGHCAAATALALLAALPLAAITPADALLAWTFALACELMLVAALALACALSLGHVTGAVSAVLAFYVLCRVLAASLLLARAVTLGDPGPLQRGLAVGIGWLAAVLPDLARYAPGTWLLEGAARAELAYVAGQTAIYLVLLAALGLVDFQRRSL
jgi:hypothetical protein